MPNSHAESEKRQQLQNSNPPTAYDNPLTFSTDLQAALVEDFAVRGSLYLGGSLTLDPQQRQALALEVVAIREDTTDPEVAASLLAGWLEGHNVSTAYGAHRRHEPRLQVLIEKLWGVLDGRAHA